MLYFTALGYADWRDKNQIFGIKDPDRLGHIYAIGKTGTGKSTLLLNMAISDIQRGNGCCIIDPHGDLASIVLKYVPQHRIDDVIYFNASDNEYSIAFNPLHGFERKDYNLITSNIINTFKKLWEDSWGPRLEYILRFAILSLLYHPTSTLLDIQPLLTNPYFRNKVLSHVEDAAILNFWKNEFDKYTPALRSEAISPILNKTGLLIAALPLRFIVGREDTSFKIQEILDSKKILICNLSKGEIGEEVSAFLGSMILTAIQSAALFRASYTLEARVPFYVYVDEVHSFITLSFIDILAESRKYGLSLFLTHQYLEQLHEKIRSAIFGNVGTVISFRIGATDAEVLEREFYPIFKADDFINLPRYSMYLKLQIDGATSKPFSATAIPLKSHTINYQEEIIRLSRNKYCKPINEVEGELNSRYHHTKPENIQGSLF